MNDSLNEKEIQKKVRREAFKRNWLLFRQSTLGMIGLGIVFFFFILAILQPILFMTGVWNEAVYHPVVGYEEIKVNLLVVECPDEYPTEKYESSNDCPGDGEITQRQIYNPNINPEVGDYIIYNNRQLFESQFAFGENFAYMYLPDFTVIVEVQKSNGEIVAMYPCN